MSEESHNENNMDLGFSDLNVTHEKKKKRKKNKEYVDLQTVDKCLRILTNSTFFDKCSTPINKKNKKKKHKKESDGLNETEEFTDGNSEIEFIKKPKTVEESHHLDTIFSDISELNTSQQSKSHKNSHDLNTILYDSSELKASHKSKKKHKESHDLNTIFPDQSKLNASHENKKKHKKNKEQFVLSTNEEKSFSKHSETALNNEEKKKKSKKNNLNVTEEFADDRFETVSVEKHRKKHKKKNQRITEENTFLDDSETISIDKQRKRKDKEVKENCDVNVAERFSENNSHIKYSNKCKMDEESQDLNNVDHGNSEFSVADKRKKHKKNKNYQEFKLCEKTTVFDESEMPFVNKEKKKKAKKSCDLNKTEGFADNNSEVPWKKHAMIKENNDLKNNSHDKSEFNITRKHKKKKYDLDITKEMIVFDDSELTSVNEQKKKKHKKVKESHDLNKTKVFADNDSESQMNEESQDLNIDQESSEINVIHKNKKRKKEITFLSESEITSIHERKKEKCKKVRESYDSNAKNMKEFADNTEINTIEKHKPNEKSQDFNNIDLDNSKCNVTPENKKKHKKNDNLSVTETFSALDNSELTSAKSGKRKKHKEKEENSNLNTNENINHFDSERALNKKHKKKHKKHKKSQNLRNEEDEENWNKEVDKNHKSHHSNSNPTILNTMLKENNQDSNNMDEANGCQLSAAEKDIEHSDNSDQSSFESGDFPIIGQNRRKTLEYEDLHLDFTEDFLEFEVPLLHETETLIPLTEERKNYLESRGVTIKTGKFLRKEDAIIKQNFENFTKKYGVSDPIVLFGIGRYRIHKGIIKFIKAKHFYARLGKDLDNRTLLSIYIRARKILNPFKNKGKFDKTDVSIMKKLHEVANKKWCHIGSLIGRSGDTCHQAYKWHEKPISKGKWTEEEKNKLVEAIKTVSGSSDVSCDKVKGISWQAVAEYIPSRNSSQCRQYWSNYFSWKLGALKQKWNKICYVKLIKILCVQWNVEDETMIDWCKVHESFKDQAPSYTFMKKRWSYLKSRIPNYKNKNYNEILKLLCKIYRISE